MIPFLKPAGASGNVLMYDRNSDVDDGRDDEGSGGDLSELESAMHPLMQAIHAKDARAMAQAFQDAFQIADLSPHDEYDPNDHEGAD